jgi:Protein of unknown function (DUF1360)
MSAFLTVLLVCAATYRITRILTQDRITDWFRNWVEVKFGPDSEITYLTGCMWCMSIWVGFGVAILSWLWVPETPNWVLLWFAASGATGLLHTWAERVGAEAALARMEAQEVIRRMRGPQSVSLNASRVSPISGESGSPAAQGVPRG